MNHYSRCCLNSFNNTPVSSKTIRDDGRKSQVTIAYSENKIPPCFRVYTEGNLWFGKDEKNKNKRNRRQKKEWRDIVNRSNSSVLRLDFIKISACIIIGLLTVSHDRNKGWIRELTLSRAIFTPTQHNYN